MTLFIESGDAETVFRASKTVHRKLDYAQILVRVQWRNPM